MEVRASRDPYQSLWMGHWKKKTSCTSFPTLLRHHTCHDEINKEKHANNQQNLPVHTAGSKKTTTINPDAQYSNCTDIQISNPTGSNMALDTAISSKHVMTGKGTLEIMDGILIKDSKGSLDETKAKTSVQMRLQNSFVDLMNATSSPFLCSGNVFSEWQNFIAFDINRKKMECVLASKKTTERSATAVDTSNPHLTLTESTPSQGEIKSVAEKHQFQEGSMAQISTQYEFLENKGQLCCGILPGDLLRSTSGSACKEFIKQPDIRSCVCTRRGSVHSISELEQKEQFTATNSFPKKQGICDCCCCSTFILSKTERDDDIIFGSSWTRLKGGPLRLLSDSPKDGFCLQILKGECGIGRKDISNRDQLPRHHSSSIPRLTRLNEIQCEHNLKCTVPACSIHDIETVRIFTTMNSACRLPGVLPKLSKTMQYLLITNKTEMDLSVRDQILREATFSAEPKENAFFKQSTIPSRFRCCDRTLTSSVNEEKKDDRCNCFTDMKYKSSPKTDSMDIDAYCGTRSLAGITNSKSNKNSDVIKIQILPSHGGGQNVEKSESTSLSLIQEVIGRDPEAKQFDVNVESFPSLDTIRSVHCRESSTSRTASLIAERNLLHAEKQEKPQPNRQLESHLGPEQSTKWVKRLRTNSDSLAVGTKSLNVEDALTYGRVHKLLGREMNHSQSNSFMLAKCLQEHQQFQKTMVLLKNRDSSVQLSKESHSWIRRLCRSSQETSRPWARQPIQMLRKPENKVVPENFKGRLFPSIAAMALMGKAANNFRPCEFRKRGSLLVWNTEGFSLPQKLYTEAETIHGCSLRQVQRFGNSSSA